MLPWILVAWATVASGAALYALARYREARADARTADVLSRVRAAVNDRLRGERDRALAALRTRHEGELRDDKIAADRARGAGPAAAADFLRESAAPGGAGGSVPAADDPTAPGD